MLDLEAVDRLLSHCRSVVDSSRAARVERYEQRLVFGPRNVMARLSGGAGALEGARCLVALTKHHHDHPSHEALAAGFDAQVDEPLDPESFEKALAELLRRAA